MASTQIMVIEMISVWAAGVMVWSLSGPVEQRDYDFAVITYATEESCREIHGSACFQMSEQRPERRMKWPNQQSRK